MKIGVVGVGVLGGRHARVASEAGVLASVYDTDEERSSRVAAEHGAKASGTIDELFSEVDAVVVASPTTTHYDVALAALESGKHVLVEKPIASTLQQARELVDVAAKNDVFLGVGHVERFNPACLAVADEGLKPAFIEAHRLARFTPRGADVAVILDLMIHDIDLALSFVQRPVESVSAVGVAVVTGTEDIAHCQLRFDGGAVANLTSSRISINPMRKMRLFQKDLYVALDMAERSVEVARLLPSDTDAEGFRVPIEDTGRTAFLSRPSPPRTDALSEQMSAFLRSANGEKTPIASGEEGMRALEVALEVQSQARAVLSKYRDDER